jgi:5'-nucleotidase
MINYSGDPPSTEKPKGPYPVLINQESGHTVLVYQAYAYGKYLGNADVTFNDSGDVIKWSGNPILLDGSWREGKY